MKNRLIIGALFALGACPSSAYEQPTHEVLSSAALRNSGLLTNGAVLSQLLDVTATFPNSSGQYQSIERLVEFGANVEDEGSRSRNHFFDPFYNRPISLPPRLTEITVPVGTASPDWILLGISQEDIEEFSYIAANASFASALSLATGPERDHQWGRVFQGLGQVVHHIQDMAQPQHVRNDPHYVSEFLRAHFEYLRFPYFEDRSWFEQYAMNRPDKVTRHLPSRPSTVKLARAREFWTTPDGRGMADFTNANFVSKDTNFVIEAGQLRPADDYPAPVPGNRRTWLLNAPELGIQNADQLCARLMTHPAAHRYPIERCEIDMIESPVFDERTGHFAVNTRSASFSVFDQALEEVADRRGLVVLNSINISAAYAFLVPQAVDYSAGLIDHFFRGRLEFVAAEPADGVIKITVKNVSAPENAFGPGTLQLYYDSANRTRKELPIQTGAELGMAQVAPGTEHTFTVPVPDDLDLTGEKPFALVYTGIIGAEEAVAGLAFEAPQIYEGFLVRVNGQLPEGYGTDRLIYKNQGSWRLHPQSNVPRGGNVDWKGGYVDGKATRLLTWSGPSRYDAETVDGFRPQVYQGGRPFVTAPAPVLGAALQQGADGVEWVVAICAVDEKDVAFKRPAKRGTSAALYDPQLAPDGWQYLGEFAGSPDLRLRRSSWLFNGSGTEAQTMRERKADGEDVLNPGDKPEPSHLARLRAAVSLSSAHFTEVDNPPIERTIRRRDSCGESESRSLWSRDEAHGTHVVAVDYADEREVVARVVVDSTAESTETVDRSSNLVGTEISSRDTSWILQLGSTQLPLHEAHSSSKTDYSALYSDTSAEYAFATSGQSTATRATLLTWDLRNGSLIAITGNTARESAHKYEDGISDRSSVHSAHFVRQIALPGRAPAVLNRTPLVSEPYNASYAQDPWNVFLHRPILQPCGSDAPREGGESVIETELVATLAAVPSVYYPAKMNVTTFATSGTDRDGNFFWSLRYSDAIDKPFFRISRLAGINVDTITGLGSASVDGPPYSPIVPN